MKEITWYGRGGQGAFTASRILGAAAMIKGYRALAFPSFGPERRGAPIRAFTRISRDGIVDRSVIRKSDYIIVLDDSLYDKEMLNSLKEGGHILINSKRDPGSFGDERVVVSDIATQAEKILKRPIVNIGILGLLTGLDPEIGSDEIFRAIEEYMPTGIADKNIRLLDRIIKLNGGESDDKGLS